jgi:glutathione peroxidase
MNRIVVATIILAAFTTCALGTQSCRAQEVSVRTAAKALPDSTAAEVADTSAAAVTSFFDLQTRTLDGEPAALGAYRGQVVLAVNVASKCGFTPQYEGLEALQRELASRGFTVLGFPSNDFKGQEPGSPQEIREFCTTQYGVTFPLFEKMRVKGDEKSEVYRFLTAHFPEPDWNFTKYLIDREGHVVERFGPRTTPGDDVLRGRILALLDGQR